MRIVFLDLDGVMNSGNYFEHRRWDVVTDPKYGNDFREIDPKAIETLNEFYEETNAKVVLSSSWRSSAFEDNLLEKCGYKGEVIDTTPHLNCRYSVRGVEILAWLKENTDNYSDFKQYVIFDDDGDMLYWQRNHFFQTTFESGLTRSITYRASRFLLSQRNL